MKKKEWVQSVLTKWEEIGNQLSELVVVCDNAPCHRGLEELFSESSASLLRLAPYSPQLNPIEIIWDKVKTYVKLNLDTPVVARPNVEEQRLQYLESVVDEAQSTISDGDRSRAIQHSSTFHQQALDMDDMPVGL